MAKARAKINRTVSIGARMNAEQLLKAAAGGGRYPRIQKIKTDGQNFDSPHEANRYLMLRAAEEQGKIRDLETQVRFPIVIGGVEVRYPPHRRNKKGRILTYVADFRYTVVETGQEVVEDAKGPRTKDYKIKQALMLAMGIRVVEV